MPAGRNSKTMRTPPQDDGEKTKAQAQHPQCKLCLATDMGTSIRQGNDWYCETCAATSPLTSQSNPTGPSQSNTAGPSQSNPAGPSQSNPPPSESRPKMWDCARCRAEFIADKIRKVTNEAKQTAYYCLECLALIRQECKDKKEAARKDSKKPIDQNPGNALTASLPPTSAAPAQKADQVAHAVCYGCSETRPLTTLRNLSDPKTGDTVLVCASCVNDYKEHLSAEVNTKVPDQPVTTIEGASHRKPPQTSHTHHDTLASVSSNTSVGDKSNLSRLSARRRQLEDELGEIERRNKAKELMASIQEEEDELSRMLAEIRLKKASVAKLCGPPLRTEHDEPQNLTADRLRGLGGRSPSTSERNATIRDWIPNVGRVQGLQTYQAARVDAENTLRWQDLDTLRHTIMEEPTRANRAESALRPQPSAPTVRNPNLFQDLDRTINETGAAAVAKVRTLLPEQLVARKCLPKELPTFNGDPAEWPKFISAYIETQAHCNYSNRENMMRLRPALTGEAYRLVEDLLNFPDNLDCVMSSLKAMYGNPERIRQAVGRRLRALPPIKNDDLTSITWMANKVRGFCSTLRAAQLERDLFNIDYLAEIEDKMPVHLRISWGVFKVQAGECNLDTIATWLASVGAATVTLGKSQPFNPSRNDHSLGRNPGARVNVHSTMSQEDREETNKRRTKTKCQKCGGNHHLSECGDFRDLDVNERWDLVVKRHLCFRCLEAHNYYRCPKTEVCGLDGCTKKHHKTLHKAENNSSATTTTAAEATIAHHRDTTSNVLFRVIPVRLHGPANRIDTYALLDEGSSVTLIDEGLAETLGASGPVEDLCLRWTGATTRTERSRRISIGVSTTDRDMPLATISDVRTIKSLDLPTQTFTREALDGLEEFRGLRIPTYRNATPRILVGLAHWRLAASMELRTEKGGLCASRSALGWAVSGTSRTPDFEEVHFHECGCRESKAMESWLRRYFEMECHGINSPETVIEPAEVVRARQILRDTTRRVEGRFEVGLLWKSDGTILPDSKPMAIKRHLCLERKLKEDPDLYNEMRRQMREYVEKGYSRPLNVDEAAQMSPRTWYLPIFVVKNPNKPGKFRVVWDAAARAHGVSLNDCLLTGPDMLSRLPGVLRRFRELRVAVTGDIAEMFHQVRVRKEDQSSQRFLWRERPTDELQTFEMTVMTFGATCSPCEAQHVKNSNAELFRDRYPEAVTEAVQNHYVDDFVGSFRDEDTAVTISQQLCQIHRHAGFLLRKFASNSSGVVDQLGDAAGTTDKDLSLGSSESKVLGIRWDINADELFYQIDWDRVDSALTNGSRKPSKRELLRHMMTVFDPLGLIAHILVQLKLLLQDVHRTTKGWDEPISAEQHKRWIWWVAAVRNLQQVRIARCYAPELSLTRQQEVELHVFVDASERVYAAAAYVRVKVTTGYKCVLVGAKTKLAPTKPLSIPRLELQAAVLGARLAQSVRTDHRLELSRTVFWSDSINVLCWIKSEERNFKQFVAFRVGEILDTSHAQDWRYVPSKTNIADVCTKLKTELDLTSTGPWYNGPEFLRQEEEAWPRTPAQLETTEKQEFRTLHVIEENHTHTIQPKRSTASPDPTRVHRWMILVRAQARVLRWIRNIRSPRHEPFTPAELEAAELELFRTCQREAYEKEIRLLSENPNAAMSKSSSLYQLTPYLDTNDGVLRMRSRLQRADVSYQTKNPVILPKGHPMTRLVLWQYHRDFHHAFQEVVCNEIRQRLYVPHLRSEVKTVIAKCQICKLKRARPQTPVMADLPTARLAVNTRPFSYVGLDYFGPMEVTVNKTIKKYWGVVMVCLTTRACHLDLSSSLRSDEAIMVIDRLVARRGEPVEIWCDNATTFKGADTELSQATDWTKAAEKYCRVVFKHIPPAAPHMGGSWERMVRSVKSSLKTILKTQRPNVEVLTTALSQIENILNSRPLMYAPIDENTGEALTPNHLLIGQSNATRPLGATPERTAPLTKQWQRAVFIAQAFWVRWVKEYLPTLMRRTKWFRPMTPIAVGDVGVIWDPARKNSWQLGRVVQVCTSTMDQQVRVIEIQTAKGIYRRPVSKFARFDVGDNTAEQSSHEGGDVEKEDDIMNIAFREPNAEEPTN